MLKMPSKLTLFHLENVYVTLTMFLLGFAQVSGDDECHSQESLSLCRAAQQTDG